MGGWRRPGSAAGVGKMACTAGKPRGRSVVDDDGSSHPQAGVWGGHHWPLGRALGDPAQVDLLTRLSTGFSELRASEQPPSFPTTKGKREIVDPFGITDYIHCQNAQCIFSQI